MEQVNSGSNRNQQVDSFISSYDSRQVSANKKEKQNSRFNKVVAVLGAAALAVTGFLAYKVVEDKGLGFGNNHSVSAGSNDNPNSMQNVSYNSYEGCGSDLPINTAKLVLKRQGFGEDKYTIITDPNQAVDVNDAGEGSFTGNPINSKSELFTQLNGNEEAMKKVVQDTATRSGDSVEEVKSNMDRWVFIQIKEATMLKNNTSFSNGQIVDAGQRINQPNDAMFVYIGQKTCDQSKEVASTNSDDYVNKTVATIGVVRAGCANPQGTWPVPYIPPKAPKPQPAPNPQPEPQPQPNPQPKPEPTPEPTPPKPPTPPTPKDPSQDVNVNPNVPDQVRGPGTTPVGEDPGPAQKPVDSGNGGAPAPAPAPQPQNPPSGGGSGDVLPPPTQAPAPANDAPKPEAPAQGNPSDF